VRFAIVIVLFATVAGPRAQTPVHEVAVTIDDLPTVSAIPQSAAEAQALTSTLLRALTSHHVPAIGFVNQDKTEHDGIVDPAHVALLRQWLDAGFELGNHTYSHADLHALPLDAFERDVVKGEPVVRDLLKARGQPLRYFRHPFLHTGRDAETRKQFESFLAARGYRVAPVTIDNEDYVFAAAYVRALVHDDHELAKRVSSAYVPYMVAKFAFFERNAQTLFGRDVRQVLLIHANALNAARVDDLASALEARGYRFVTLDRALEDPAYQSLDTYVGPGGITWLHRWALTRQMPKSFYAGEPVTPAFVAEAARP
jgi:peptidoglycan/xylan/chitin deacetylase (PgdA/CDA1 family)